MPGNKLRAIGSCELALCSPGVVPDAGLPEILDFAGKASEPAPTRIPAISDRDAGRLGPGSWPGRR